MQAVVTGLWGICIYSAFEYASVSIVSLFAASTPLLLVIWKAFNQEATRVEWFGVGIAMIGTAIVCLFGGVGGGSGPQGASSTDTIAGIIPALVSESLHPFVTSKRSS